MKTRRQMLKGIAATAASSWSTPLWAQATDYPNRPVHVTLGLAAGSGADVMARYMTDQLQKLTGRSFVLENRPGATGQIANRFVAKSPPDGYNILLAGNSGISAAQFLVKDLPYDPLNDIKPVASFAATIFVVVVSSKSSVHSMDQLIASIKSKRDPLYGFSNTTGLFSAELIKSITGVSARQVAYKTPTDALRDINEGMLEFIVMDGTFAAMQMDQGLLRGLAVTTKERTSAFPNLPPLSEAGVAGFDFSPWWAAYVPAATPQPIVDKLEGWFHQINKMPETATFLASIAAVPQNDGSKEAQARLRAELPKWPDLVKRAGLEPQ